MFTLIVVPLIAIFLNIGAYSLAAVYVGFYLLVSYYLYYRHVKGVKPLGELFLSGAKRTLQGPKQRLQGGYAKLTASRLNIFRRRSKERSEPDNN